MKIKILYLLVSCLLFIQQNAQQTSLNLSKANCQRFQKAIYVFGLSYTNSKTQFHLYKFDSKAALKDSFLLVLNKNKRESYLQIYSDTLHGFLNIYLQKEDANEVDILRFNKNFELEARIERVDIARLNNNSLFSHDILYFQKDVYSVKIVSDTSGKQFYINKYDLKSTNENFDYSFVWQFPFERKNILDAHLFYASKSEVMVFVHVSEGIKKGQWVLKLNAKTGHLLKATKLNAKNETSTFFYGSHVVSSTNRALHLIGEEFSASLVDLSQNKFQIADASHLSLYHLEIDSLGNLGKKQNYKVPITVLSSGAKKTKNTLLLNFQKIEHSSEGDLTFESDVFKNTDQSYCFSYVNTLPFRLKKDEEGYQLIKTTVTSNKSIEDFYSTPDKMDLNGKQCVDSLIDLPKFFYGKSNFPVKVHFKLDSTQSPCWLLSKHSFQKNNVNYSVLHPVNKIYKVESISDISESKSPGIITLSDDTFLIFHQSDEDHFQLNYFSW